MANEERKIGEESDEMRRPMGEDITGTADEADEFDAEEEDMDDEEAEDLEEE